ncbi:Serine/threonine-protein phosphatase 7 long form homolog [Linum grandiflorum]
MLDTGLYPIAAVSNLVPGMGMCTTLIERWRPKTNTFYMYHIEITITLEDVSFITGLLVDRTAVFG